jgi:dihydroorotase (multifunctional complex type)
VSVDLILKNGIVILQGAEAERSVAIRAGKINGVYTSEDEPAAKNSIDCKGLYILPGAIDIHVHLRDLKQSEKEDYASGTRAAAAGGITTVVDMPNSVPPVLNQEVLDEKISRARQQRFVNVGFYAGLPKNPSKFNVSLLSQVLGVKVYPHSPLDKGSYTKKRIRGCMEVSAKNEIPLLLHPDASKPKSKPEDINDYYTIHNCENEVNSLQMFLDAQKEVGGRIHVCHVSCEESLRYLVPRRSGLNLTAEVTPHHLFLKRKDFTHKNGYAKMLPPLRSKTDNEALWLFMRQCGIDCVVSDHAPHTKKEKKLPFLEAAAGIPGLETLVPLMLTEVFEGRLSWVEYLRCCCSAPAQILGIHGKGLLAKGYDADIIIVSKEESHVVGSEFHSKSKTTPFEGRKLMANPIITIVRGDIVFSHDEFVVGPGVTGMVPVRKL